MKGPASVQAQNLAPWNWKYERAPKLYNPGPEEKLSINSMARGPLLADGQRSIAAPVGCLQSEPLALEPVAGGSVIDHREAPTLEDGK